jgi:predicted aspartyl protease
VSAKINGAGPVTLILDTGADRTMVAPAALGRLGVAVPNTLEATLRGVTGSSRAPVVWVSSLEVGNAAAGPLPIVAHDADLEQADGLLGRDFLALFTVTIDANAGVVTVRRP